MAGAELPLVTTGGSPMGIGGFFTSTEFVSQIATFIATLLSGLVQALLGSFFSLM
jgi:hypothetical protein